MARLYGISKWEKDSEALLKVQERVAADNTDVLPHDLRSKW
jgi:hypothetical protein